MRKYFVDNIQSVVIKIGTSILATDGRFDKKRIQEIADQISQLLIKGIRVSIVTSGAIGAGMTLLKEKERPKTMEGLQAAAAIGQRYLMQCYEDAFSRHGFSTAQILLTWEDLAHENRLLNAKRTLKEIQRRGIVPVINENDTVATDEIRFGDNDKLSSLIAILVQADALVILSDTNGLFERAGSGLGERIKVVEKMDKKIFSHVRDTKKKFTVGGMQSKLNAVHMSVTSGVPVFLASGKDKNIIPRVFAAEDVGTFFLPEKKKGQAKKTWVADFLTQIQKNKFSNKKK